MKPTFRSLTRRLAAFSQLVDDTANEHGHLDREIASQLRFVSLRLAKLSQDASDQSRRDPLPEAQARVLTFVRTFIQTHRKPPTRKEIADGLGFASPNAAQDHLKRLAARGELKLGEFEDRAIKLNKRAGL